LPWSASDSKPCSEAATESWRMEMFFDREQALEAAGLSE